MPPLDLMVEFLSRVSLQVWPPSSRTAPSTIHERKLMPLQWPLPGQRGKESCEFASPAEFAGRRASKAQWDDCEQSSAPSGEGGWWVVDGWGVKDVKT